MLTALVYGLGAASARAHDPAQSFTLATIRAADLELNLTMAQLTALKLADLDPKVGALTTENFAHYRDQLAAAGRAMFVVTAGTSVLPVQSVRVELTEENDVSIRLYYARPPPGRLHLHAAFLRKLGDGFGGILDTTDDAGRQLGWDQLTWDNPNLEITVPTPAAPRKN
jgi:hypothetical protein